MSLTKNLSLKKLCFARKALLIPGILWGCATAFRWYQKKGIKKNILYICGEKHIIVSFQENP